MKFKLTTFLILFSIPLFSQSDYLCEDPTPYYFYQGINEDTVQAYFLDTLFDVEYDGQDAKSFSVKHQVNQNQIRGLQKLIFGEKDRYIAKDTTGKYGLVNGNLNIVIPLEYEELYFVGLRPELHCIVKINGKWGIIDSLNQFVVQPEYSFIFGYTQDLVYLKDNEHRYIFNLNTHALTYIKHYCVNAVMRDNKSLDIMKIYDYNNVGLMDAAGNILVPCSYDDVNQFKFNNTTYYQANKNNKIGILDSNANILIPIQYNYLKRYNVKGEMQFYVKKDKKMGIIDIQNNIIFPFEYDDLSKYGNQEKYIIRAKKEDKYAVLNQNFEIFIPFELDRFTSINYYPSLDSYFMIFQKNGKLIYYIDEEKLDFENGYFEFGDAHIYQDSLLENSINLVVYDKVDGVNLAGIYDIEKKKFVVDYKYEKITIYFNEYFLFHENDKIGILNTNDEIIVKPEYDKIYFFSEGMARIIKENKWGFLNEDFKTVIPPTYDMVEPFKNGVSKVVNQGKTFYINKKGECVKDCY